MAWYNFREGFYHSHGKKVIQVKSTLSLLFLFLCVVGFAVDYAILVGIDDYHYLTDLEYAQKDVADMQRLLQGLGFEVQTLTGTQANVGAIRAAIRDLGFLSTPYDLLLFYFSGHGFGGDNEEDRGIFTCYMDPVKDKPYSQQQILADLQEFKGDSVLFLDACYQGSLTRDLQRTPRFDIQTAIQNGELALFVAASSSDQAALDGASVDGIQIQNGIATYLFLKGVGEKEADLNDDGRIFMGEMAEYFEIMASKIEGKIGQRPQAAARMARQALISNLESLALEPEPPGPIHVEQPPVEPPAVQTPQATLVVQNPRSHSVYLDGNFTGWDQEKTFQLDAGEHSVAWKDAGRLVFQQTVVLEPGQTLEVDGTPPPIPDAGETAEPQADQGNQFPQDMVEVKAGSFRMGKSIQEVEWYMDIEYPAHLVKLTYAFLVGRTEVTLDDYSTYCLATGKSGRGSGTTPVTQVSWWDAIGYCNWRSEQEGFAKAYDNRGNLLDARGVKTSDISQVEGYRLPTEAEWEYAARGGHLSQGNKRFAGSDSLDAVGWYSGNSGNHAHPVGGKSPNELGVFDMSGNVWEWCLTKWRDDYNSPPDEDPEGDISRVVRGGSYASTAWYVRCAIRSRDSPDFRNWFYGFRVVVASPNHS